MNKRFAVVLSLWGIRRALAAVTTDAVCTADFNWAYNDLNQSPCILAGYLQAACETGDWNVPALPQYNRYNGPNSTQANICTCSSVTYNALSMCAACQDPTRTWLNWPGWKASCPSEDVKAGNYTQDIPKNTSIPYWAYMNPESDPSSTFNLTTARGMDLQNIPDTRAPVHTDTTNDTQSPSKSNNTGVIVGSVLGGIAIVIMIVCAAVFIFRKRRSSRESSAPSKRYINNWSKKVKAGRPPSATDDSRSRWEAESAWGEKVTSYEVSNIHRPQSVTSFERQARSPTPSSKTFPTGNMSNPGKFGARTTNEHAITPYILSPIVDSHTSDTTTLYGSGSPDHLRTSPVAMDRRSSRVGRSSSEWFKPKRRNSSQSSAPSQPILLPSTVEYSGTKKDIAPFVQQLPPTLYPPGAPTGYYNPDDPSTFPTPIVGPPRRNSNDSSRHPLSGSYMSHGSGPTPPEHGNSRHSHTLSGGGSHYPANEALLPGPVIQPSGRLTPQMGRVSPPAEPTAPFLPPTHTRSPSSTSPTGRFNAIIGRMKPARTLSNQSGTDYEDPNRVALDQMGNDWSPHAPNAR